MSRLIAQIMLSILLFPLAALLYLLTFIVLYETQRGMYGGYYRSREQTAFLLAGAVTWAFMAWYWIVLWRRSVQWTPERRRRTGFCVAAAAAIAAVLGVAVNVVVDESGFGIFMGTAAAPLLWLVGTVLIWRETDAERAQRLAERGMAGGLVCPTCGYNLNGLKGTRCPECGSEFTLDALIASQPVTHQADVER
jgi:hypothetical protein